MNILSPLRLAPGFLALLGAFAGGVLIFTGLMKVSAFEVFVEAVTKQGVMPAAWIRLASVAFVVLELLVGLAAVWLCVSSNSRRRWAMWLLATFFGGLTVYCSWLWMHPPIIAGSCGCGLSSRIIEDWAPMVRRDGGVALAFALGALVFPGRRGSERF